VRDFSEPGHPTPESVIVLAGSFVMGSSAFEDGREENEGPEHRITFRRGFAIGLTEVTFEQFRAFVHATGYKTDAEKHGESTVYDHYSGRLAQREGITWEMDYEGRKARTTNRWFTFLNDAQATCGGSRTAPASPTGCRPKRSSSTRCAAA
jgi:formylglycine-generating enzyme required for sulfatase activity